MNKEKLILENQQAIMNMLFVMKIPESKNSAKMLMNQMIKTAKALNPKEVVPYEDSLDEDSDLCDKCGHGEKDHWNGYCEHCDLEKAQVCNCNGFVKSSSNENHSPMKSGGDGVANSHSTTSNVPSPSGDANSSKGEEK